MAPCADVCEVVKSRHSGPERPGISHGLHRSAQVAHRQCFQACLLKDEPSQKDEASHHARGQVGMSKVKARCTNPSLRACNGLGVPWQTPTHASAGFDRASTGAVVACEPMLTINRMPYSQRESVGALEREAVLFPGGHEGPGMHAADEWDPKHRTWHVALMELSNVGLTSNIPT